MHVVNLPRGLDEGPWHTTLVAGRVSPGEEDMAYYAEERGVRVRYLPALAREIRPLDDLRTLWALYRLFRTDRPAVVHTHTAKAGTLGRVAALLAGVPTLVHTYHGHVLGGGYFSPRMTRFFLAVEQQLARATDRLVVLTETQAEEMSGALGVAARDRFAVIPLGLELEDFAEVDRGRLGPAARDSLGVGPDELTVGIVGRMVPIKNHELWLEAMAALIRRSPRPVRGLVVGSGEREAELRELARELGIEARILWLGWRRDLPDLYAAMDVLALTSHDEGTPVAVIEALAAGTRVVARDVGGVAEVLGGLGTGAVLAREADGPAWGGALERAVEGEAPPPALRAAVVDRYSVQRLARDIAGLYEELKGA
jgi:glycosyltransferase involved in cell wall biosynthesis